MSAHATPRLEHACWPSSSWLGVLSTSLLLACSFPEYQFALPSGSGGASGAASGGATVGAGGMGNAGTSAGGGPVSQGGTSGAGGTGAAAGAGGSASCVPGPDDLVCNGLDQACQPVEIDSACPQGCTGASEAGREYMSCSAASDFAQAETRCQTQGMHLIHVHDGAENQRLVELARAIGSYVWIGGSSQLDQTSFTWNDDGSAFYKNGAPVTGAYENFDVNQPVDNPGRQCVQVHDSTGLWSNVQCSDVLQFVCAR